MRWFPPLLIAVALLAAACSESPEGQLGEQLFNITCSSCHGADLRGGVGPGIGPGSNTDLNLTDEQVAGVIGVGPGAMPGFGSTLDERQIESLVIYIRSVQNG